MSNKNYARRTVVKLYFKGADISKELSKYLLSLSFTDKEEDETDDISLSLDDREGKWIKDWLNTSKAVKTKTETVQTSEGSFYNAEIIKESKTRMEFFHKSRNEAEENSEITEEADADATDAAVENQSVEDKENADFEIESEEKVISDDGKYEEAAQAEISTEEEPTDEIEETIEEVESEYEEETEDKVEEENEEELRREAEKNTADDFDEGYDFFEEKPRRIVGIIDVDSSDLKNAVDYDVLSEEEKRAVEVETAVDNDKTESFIAAAEKAGNGIKNFFVHCGYFCTNVSRLIKRKHAAKKRKKAELERRERERVRKQQAAQRRDGNGLVKVHSATQRRPRPNGRASQSAHRTPNRKPQQNNNRRK